MSRVKVKGETNPKDLGSVSVSQQQQPQWNVTPDGVLIWNIFHTLMSSIQKIWSDSGVEENKQTNNRYKSISRTFDLQVEQ